MRFGNIPESLASSAPRDLVSQFVLTHTPSNQIREASSAVCESRSDTPDSASVREDKQSLSAVV